MRKLFHLQLLVFLSIVIFACSSSDETGNQDLEERTEIIMDLPSNSEDINWNNVELIWSDEFDDSEFIGDTWYFEKNTINNPDKADELQVYNSTNLEESGETLKIYAKKIGEGQNRGDYTSASAGCRYAFQYGRIEIRAKLPGNEKNGLWAKIAMIGNNESSIGWPKSGQLDIVEYVSYNSNEPYFAVHSAVNNSLSNTLISEAAYVETAEEELHNYGVLWTDEYLKFYVDEVDNIILTFNRPEVYNENNWPFDQPFYLFIDLVVGGKYGGAQGVDDSLFPASLEVDYIRLYHPSS